MKGKQLYDTENKTLIVPKLFGPRGSGAYFADGDWKKAAAAGMSAAGLDFSGKYDWVTTEMIIPVNHQVLPKDKSLRCEACHSRDGRLENVKAGWVPGRDRSLFLDIVGILALLGALGMAAMHGFMRYKSSQRKGSSHMKKVLMYTRFERFWHWAQALLIFFLALTGFEVHGSFSLFGYQNSVVWHMYAGVILVILFAFAIFWHFTTRAWRAYIPTSEGLIEQMLYSEWAFSSTSRIPITRPLRRSTIPFRDCPISVFRWACCRS
jgi:hypothetical protein